MRHARFNAGNKGGNREATGVRNLSVHAVYTISS